MKESGGKLGIVYHVDVTFYNGKERRNTYYNADNAKEAVRYYTNKYGYTYDWSKKMGVTEDPSMGPTYEVNGKLYKKHYTGNPYYYFWSRFVDESVTYNNDEDRGKSLLCCLYPDNTNKK